MAKAEMPAQDVLRGGDQRNGDYTGIRAFPAEGARVGIITCRRCGAALFVDPADSFDVMFVHDDWHDRVQQSEVR